MKPKMTPIKNGEYAPLMNLLELIRIELKCINVQLSPLTDHYSAQNLTTQKVHQMLSNLIEARKLTEEALIKSTEPQEETPNERPLNKAVERTLL